MIREKLIEFARRVLDKVLTVNRLERMIAFAIDLLAIVCVSLLPPIGIILGVVYFFLRDSLPFGVNASFGKNIYSLKVITVENEQIRRAPWHKSVVRCLILIIPILNLVDIFYFLRDGKRLVDTWLGTDVICERKCETISTEEE